MLKRGCLLMLVTLIAVSGSSVFAAGTAKNVILMISDGAGYNSWDAASYYQYGQLGQQIYDSAVGSYDWTKYACTTYMTGQGYDPVAAAADFNYVKGSNDYGVFTDSAAAATALYTGQKTYKGAVSVDVNQQNLTTIAEIAAAQGKATGAISSVQLSHATPAAVDAHNASRNNYAAIANEMIYNSDLDVIMGCGIGHSSEKYVGGPTTLADIQDVDGANGFTYVHDVADFQALANGALTASKVLGIADTTYTIGDEYLPAANDESLVPTLETMTNGALNVLGQDSDGFFLMVEGGAVDWNNHGNALSEMITEQIDFNRSVEAAVAWVNANSNWDETLLVITADHECGMLWGDGTWTDTNANGFYDDGVDIFNGFKSVVNNGAGNLPGAMYGSGGHTNALVPVWALGCGSTLFSGLVDGADCIYGDYVDNTDIFTVMNTVVPEPTTMLLLGLGSLGLIRRKK